MCVYVCCWAPIVRRVPVQHVFGAPCVSSLPRVHWWWCVCVCSAGKTTLLDVLAGRKSTGEVTGDILVNGVKISKSALR